VRAWRGGAEWHVVLRCRVSGLRGCRTATTLCWFGPFVSNTCLSCAGTFRHATSIGDWASTQLAKQVPVPVEAAAVAKDQPRSVSGVLCGTRPLACSTPKAPPGSVPVRADFLNASRRGTRLASYTAWSSRLFFFTGA